MSNPETSYVYVIVRQDLPRPIQAVQACHATLAATNTFIGSEPITHPHLVLCAVDDESALRAAFNRLKDQGVPCCAYMEDDLGNQMTAVATAPLKGEARRPLRGFRLLR